MRAAGTALDKPVEAAADGWTAPPQMRFERLLREAGIPAGLLCTPEGVRLVLYARGRDLRTHHLPHRRHGAVMAQVMGRPILAAFSLLLGEYRMFRAEPRERLGSLVAASREAQNLVSTVLGKRQARCRCSRTERSGGCSNGCWYSTASGSPIARLTSKKSARSTAGRAGKRGLALEPNLGPKRPDTGSHIG